MPPTNTSRSCAPPVFWGSRSTTICPAPVSARKMSPLGATVSQRGYLKSLANTFTRKPGGTVGKKPAGGFVPLGPLPADFVSKGGGNLGFCPCVTCAGKLAARKRLKAERQAILAGIKVASLNSDSLMPACGCRLQKCLVRLLRSTLTLSCAACYQPHCSPRFTTPEITGTALRAEPLFSFRRAETRGQAMLSSLPRRLQPAERKLPLAATGSPSSAR